MFRSPAAASLALLLGLWAASPVVADSWTAPTAETTLAFDPVILGNLGLQVVAETGGAPLHSVPPSLLEFRAPGGDFERFDAGVLHHDGGFVLAGPGGLLDLDPVVLRVASGRDDFDWVDAAGRRWLVLRDMHFLVSFERQELQLVNLSVHLAPELARWLGREDLAWAYVGEATIRLPALVPPELASGGSGAGVSCTPNSGLPIDVELTDIAAASQLAREAGVRVALAPSAELLNVGQGSVDWFRAIEPQAGAIGPHPFLSLAMYRLGADGRLVQLGLGDVKHAFFAVNSGCPCSGGQVLFPGCGDEYGVSTNANRQYLAPRDEVSAFTGSWERVGSHFDNCIPIQPGVCDAGDDADDFRDHGGNNALYHDAFEHLLVVPEPALEVEDATYFVDAWYVVEDDVDIFNSMGHRPVDPTLDEEVPNVWGFPFTDAMVSGSVLDEIPGAQRLTLDTGEGRIDLAVTTEDLGGGVHHYRYALLNFDFDRQIERFEVPIAPGMVVSSTDSSGLGDDPANDWPVTVGADAVSWQAPPGGALDWGMFQRFELDVDSAPEVGEVGLAVLEPGDPHLLAAVPTPVPEPSPGLSTAVGLLTLVALRASRRDGGTLRS